MSRGKTTCKVLKEVRRKIADANGIPLQECECTHTGDCAGTCPYCESEVRYLERELSKRRNLGKAVAVAGIAAVAVMPAMAQTPENTTVRDTIASSDVNLIMSNDNPPMMGETIRVRPWKAPHRQEWRFPREYGSVKSYVKKEINKNPALRQWIDDKLQTESPKQSKSDRDSKKAIPKSERWYYDRIIPKKEQITLFLDDDGRVTAAHVFEFLKNPTDDDLIMMDELSHIFIGMPRWEHNDKDYPSPYQIEIISLPHSILR